MKSTGFCWVAAIVLTAAMLLLPSLAAAKYDPNIRLSNVRVNFISEREIEISGNIQCFDLYSYGVQKNGLAPPNDEWAVAFNWIPEGGSFVYLVQNTADLVEPVFWDLRYPPTDGPIGHLEWQKLVADWAFLESPSYYEDGRLMSNGDDGRVFTFNKRFTLPEAAPTPYKYRVVAMLMHEVGGLNRFWPTELKVIPPQAFFVYDTFGPFRISPGIMTSANVIDSNISGKAMFNMAANTLHVPLLDAEILGGGPGEMWWVDLGLDSLDAAPVFVMDTAKGVGGLGTNTGYSPYTDLISTFSPSTNVLHIPEVDIGDGNTYWLDLRLLPNAGTRIALGIDDYAPNPVDYSDALGKPCESDTGFVRSLYQSVLERDLEVSFEPGHGAAHLQSLLDGATRRAVILAFFHSPEYQNKQKSDEAFLRDAFQAALGREPDLLERGTDVGTSRDAFLAVLFDSAEYQNLLTACGQTP